MQIRLYNNEDYQMIALWCKQHGSPVVPSTILPRLGVIVTDEGEDIAAIWLYMDNSVGVCFAEHAVSKPKLSLKRAREAFFVALNFLRIEAKSNDYGIMFIHTKPTIARILRGYGYLYKRSNLVTMSIETGGGENG